MKTRLLSPFLPCFLLWLGLSAQVLAATAMLTPVADTFITQRFPDSSNAGASELICGSQGTMAGGSRNRALFKFEPGQSIPQGATITAARFTLTVTKAPDLGVDSNFGLRRVLRDWKVDQATWKLRATPNLTWTQPGGAEGTDYSETISASTLVSEAGPYAYDSTAEAVADVQSWLDHPSANFGWILISDQESQLFSARRLSAVDRGAEVPTLEVDYTIVPQPTIQDAHINQGLFSFQFDAEPAYCYTVEFRDAVGAGPWGPLTNFCAKLVTERVLAKDPDPVSSHPNRFYRVSVTGPVR